MANYYPKVFRNGHILLLSIFLDHLNLYNVSLFFSLSHFFLTLPESGLKLKMSGLLNFQEFYTSMRLGGRGRTETDQISLFPRILHYQGVRETY